MGKEGLYVHAQPNGHFDWLAAVRIDGRRYRFALRLETDEAGKVNLGEAKKRRKDLERDIEDRKLKRVSEWMSKSAQLRLAMILKEEKIEQGKSKPAILSWEEHSQAYKEEFRFDEEVPDKMSSFDFSGAKRGEYLRWLTTLLNERVKPGSPFDATEILSELAERKSERSYTSVDIAFSYLFAYTGYLAKKGLCTEVDKDKVKKKFPPKPPKRLNLPSGELDLGIIRTFHKHRLDSGKNFAAWSLLLLTRGLGCRPNEAATLSRTTIWLNDSQEVVNFIDPKENRRFDREHRVVPILFAWVRDGIREVMERHAENESPAFVIGERGKPYRDLRTAGKTFMQVRKALGLPDSYTLKLSQKAHIDQLRSMRIPDAVVAPLTGHTAETYARHYIHKKSYVRLDRFNFEEFGKLTEYGLYHVNEWGGRP